jgi:hypothetical protein
MPIDSELQMLLIPLIDLLIYMPWLLSMIHMFYDFDVFYVLSIRSTCHTNHAIFSINSRSIPKAQVRLTGANNLVLEMMLQGVK